MAHAVRRVSQARSREEIAALDTSRLLDLGKMLQAQLIPEPTPVDLSAAILSLREGGFTLDPTTSEVLCALPSFQALPGTAKIERLCQSPAIYVEAFDRGALPPVPAEFQVIADLLDQLAIIAEDVAV